MARKSRLTILLLCVLSGPRVIAQTTKSGFIKTSDGVRIHYVEAGEGKAIVFIPGWMMPGGVWQKQIDGLSKKYRVIPVDPRSQRESVVEFHGNSRQIVHCDDLTESRARLRQLLPNLHKTPYTGGIRTTIDTMRTPAIPEGA